MDDLVTALEMTVIGMALVFAAIMLLWGTMELLVRLTAEREIDPRQVLRNIKPKDKELQSLEDFELKRRAAVIAVAVALAREADSKPHAFPLPPTSVASAWQSVMRGRQLKQRGPR